MIEAITYAAVTVRARTRGGASVQGTRRDPALGRVGLSPRRTWTTRRRTASCAGCAGPSPPGWRDDQYEDPIQKGNQVGNQAAVELAVQLAEE